ncbi:MAG TPA: PQQ-dependent sugar dehydrogenase [Mycobacteriales bacterium]|nr:PQQ-dependent sugar dehydrogenase [Mycobacteriales bacterium]
MALTRRPPLPRAAVASGALLLVLTACGGDDPAPAAGPDAPTAAPTSAPDGGDAPDGDAAPAQVDPSAPQVLVTGLQVPWGLAFVGGGDALVAERDTGRLLRVPAAGGDPVELTRFDDVDDTGEGGLLGLTTSPTDPDLVYAYYTGPQDNRVVRFRVDSPDDREPVLTGIPKGRTHNGGRIAFGPDGHLYVGTGDAGQADLAQDDDSLAGKVLRVTEDGEPVDGGSPVFSKGHRNVQGLSFDDDGRLYAVEFGPDRDDEVNQVSLGDNAGWPEVTGDDDGGGRFLTPVVVWADPAEASPSGSAIVGDTLYVAALRGNRLWAVPLDGAGGAGEPEPVLQGEFGRLRTLVTAPDGSLWITTSNRDGRGSAAAEDDRILRLPPG